jgi:hypothetical protein
MNTMFEHLRDNLRSASGGEQREEFRDKILRELKYNQELQYRTSKALSNVRNFPDTGYGELPFLCDKYGCNKGSVVEVPNKKFHPYYPFPPHTYTDIYEVLFRPIKHSVQNVFECGIGTDKTENPSRLGENAIPGASLRVWRDFFPNATVWGGDIDKDVLFAEERIMTGYIDQTNSGTVRDFFAATQTKFDIMIDDGLHTLTAAECLLENSIDYLIVGGIYIIEDADVGEMRLFYKWINNYTDLAVKYLIMETPRDIANNLILIRKTK